ncbi:unnamed protein product, partial [marine sediment metagenome]
MLVFPAEKREDDDVTDEVVLEESRVYYVGATRARASLAVAALSAPRVSYLKSKRIYRRLAENTAQLEIGREGDVDRVAHLSWTKAKEVQRSLATLDGTCPGSIVTAAKENQYQRR